MIKAIHTTILAAIAVTAALPAAQAQTLIGNEPSYLDIGLGAFNAIDPNNEGSRSTSSTTTTSAIRGPLGAFHGTTTTTTTTTRANAPAARPLPEAQIEFRYGQKLFGIGPAAGMVANNRGGFMVYSGLYSDIAFGNVIVTPLGGIGGYHRGNGKDLGSAFEFRLSLSVRYQLGDGSRVGLQFAHVSNAFTGRINPGDEEVLITYALPLSF